MEHWGLGCCEKKKPSIDGAHHMAHVIRCAPVAQWTEAPPGFNDGAVPSHRPSLPS
ncbi:hypothetical protein COCNU_16G004680 [Cocos nucifera]|uniref:Uncharacterized protein n=1 Tax=Cocos nucifera TaxID=13894 RepID=A0A8K0NFR7_COCNU|nr:hypothetical protein COCNU_16G004680 [Cocos nucifera]